MRAKSAALWNAPAQIIRRRGKGGWSARVAECKVVNAPFSTVMGCK